MTNEQTIRVVAHWLADSDDDTVTLDLDADDDSAFDALVARLALAGAWIGERRDARGRLALTAEEARRLLWTDAGRELRDSLRDELDLSALFDDEIDGLSLDDQRAAWRQLLWQRNRAAASSIPTVRDAWALPMAAANVAPVLKKGIVTSIWAEFSHARLLPDGTVLALGVVPAPVAEERVTPVLYVARPQGLADIHVAGLPLGEAVPADELYALIHVASPEAMPEVLAGQVRLDLVETDAQTDDLVLDTLRALRADRLADGRQILAALSADGDPAADGRLAVLWRVLVALQGDAGDHAP